MKEPSINQRENSPNKSEGVKWGVEKIIALLAAGSGIVALLTYFSTALNKNSNSAESITQSSTPARRADPMILGFPSFISIDLANLQAIKTKYEIDVYNDGNAPARDSHVSWSFPPKWIPPKDIWVTNTFGLAPNEKRTVTLDLWPLQQLIISEGAPWRPHERGNIRTEGRLYCNGKIVGVYNNSLSVFPSSNRPSDEWFSP